MIRIQRMPVAALALALAACAGDDHALLGTLERDRVELVAEGQETLLQVAVHEGETVKSGQLLVQLDPEWPTADR